MPEIIKHNAKHIIFASMAAVLLLIGGLWFVQRDSEAQSFRDTDLNQDGVIDQADTDLLRAAFDSQDLAADFNNDGQVNTYDLFLFNQDYGDGDSEERDFDGDKYSVLGHDCDDTNPDIHPFKPEEANGIDDNCNGAVDEFVDFKPITTSEWYEVFIDFVADESGQLLPVVGQQAIQKRNFEDSVTNPLTIGENVIEVLDSGSNVIDQVAFSSPEFESEPLFVDEGTARESTTSAYTRTRVMVPWSSDAASLSLIDGNGQKTPLDLSGASSQIRTSDVPEDPESNLEPCPEEYRPDEGGRNGVAWCVVINEPDNSEHMLRVLGIMKEAGEVLPEIFYYGFNALAAYPYDIVECSPGRPANACYVNGLNEIHVASADRSDEVLEIVIVHEMAHRLHNLIEDGAILLSHGYDYPGTPNDELMEQLYASLVEFMNSEKCGEDEGCVFQPREFTEAWEGVDPEEGPAWKGGCQDPDAVVPQDEYVLCEPGRRATWLEIPVFDPLSQDLRLLNNSPVGLGEEDNEYGARPYDPGNVSSYGSVNNHEGFAETYTSWFLSEKYNEGAGTDEERPTPLCKIFNRYLTEDPPSDNQLQATSHLRRIVTLFGQHGLIKDANHNGIPDSCDIASPSSSIGYCGGTPPRVLENGEVRPGYHPSCGAPQDSERYQDCLDRRVSISLSDPNMKPGCSGLITGTARLSLGGVANNGCVVGSRGAPPVSLPSQDLSFMTDPPRSWERSAFYTRKSGVCGSDAHSFYNHNGCTVLGNDGYGNDVHVPYSCWFRAQ